MLIDPLSIIERSLYEAIRLVLVTQGLTPDISTFGWTKTGYDNYQTALAQIKTTKGFAVELFGPEAPNYRGSEKLPRIVLDLNSFVPGTYGIEPSGSIEEVDSKWVPIKTENRVFDLFMNCTILAETQSQLRTLMYIVHSTIPNQGFLKYYDDADITDEDFLCILDNSVRLDRDMSGILGQQYTYQIPDVSLVEPKIGTEIVAINQITLELYLSDYLGITQIYNL